MKRKSSGLNLLLAVDKPAGMTSHDVVNRIRRVLGESRVGHAGTLDPFATGVMVVGVGQATRLMQYATAERKAYVARFAWGSETTTDDVEGSLRCEAPMPAEVADRAWAEEAVSWLKTVKEQVPPVFSAIKVDGRRSYDAARKGQEFQLEARPVEVFEAKLLDIGFEGDVAWWDIEVDVSKGTYVRALARDLGRQFGSACHLTALRRIASGSADISSCAGLDHLGSEEVLPVLDPVSTLGYPAVYLTEQDVADVRCGKRLSLARTDSGRGLTFELGSNVCLVSGDYVYAVARRDEKALVPTCVFQDGIRRTATSTSSLEG